MKKMICIAMGFLMLGCGGSDTPSKPDNLISKEKMSDIIYDVFILNAAKGINKRILEQNGVFPQDYIYEKYKIDSLQFALSNDYYSYDTKIYEGIMDRVKQKIDVEKIKIDAINLRERKTKDSLNKLMAKAKDSLHKNKKLQKMDTISPPKSKLKHKVFGKDED